LLERYQGGLRQRDFTCSDQYPMMAFAQLTYRESLRDIEAWLRSLRGELCCQRIRGEVVRSTRANPNESRGLAHLRRLRAEAWTTRRFMIRTGTPPLWLRIGGGIEYPPEQMPSQTIGSQFLT